MTPSEPQAGYKITIVYEQEVGYMKIGSEESCRDNGANNLGVILYEVDDNLHVEDDKQTRKVDTRGGLGLL